MMNGYPGGVGFDWLWMVGMAILVIGVVLLIVWLAGRAGPVTQPPAPTAPPPAQDALELLRMRFARGEINESEYRSAKQVLEDGR